MHDTYEVEALVAKAEDFENNILSWKLLPFPFNEQFQPDCKKLFVTNLLYESSERVK